MKSFIIFRSFLSLTGGALLAASNLNSANYHWDCGAVNFGINGNRVSLGNFENWDKGENLTHLALTNSKLATAVFVAMVATASSEPANP
jgi:hypothetical protein